MTVTFFGHADFIANDEYERQLLSILEENVGDACADMFLGGYGKFDAFAYNCCKKYQLTHPNIKLVYVTPYMTLSYQKNHLEHEKTQYYHIVYPDIEDKPLKFAISYRNKYMAKNADLVIAYVCRASGGAYQALKHARASEKTIFNLGEIK